MSWAWIIFGGLGVVALLALLAILVALSVVWMIAYLDREDRWRQDW